ncbi:hypothetical protein Dsin_020711 [Dipteronia sinensis]|uniref:Uncharacterized protein n=1 Tax=Dipteronia sinensis TaxID=43782 RepID=A0AAE0E3X7_9ROSI|nr:hypothetical protein Dsin_020711 [Dipteronia sinensis]
MVSQIENNFSHTKRRKEFGKGRNPVETELNTQAKNQAIISASETQITGNTKTHSGSVQSFDLAFEDSYQERLKHQSSEGLRAFNNNHVIQLSGVPLLHYQ